MISLCRKSADPGLRRDLIASGLALAFAPFQSTPMRDRRTGRQDQVPPSAKGPSVETVPDGDSQARLVCPDCGYIAYDNPKIVVGAICVWDERVLLCRRAIEPARGLWTFPSGYMELGETMQAGALREVWEEAQARAEIGGLVGIYEVPRISQVYVVYGARMRGPEHGPGPESEAVELIAWDAIPWDDLAFPSIRWALERYREAPAGSIGHRIHGVS